MYSLLQSARIRGSAGLPLPNPFQSLEARGTHFLRGQFVLVAAGPGTGKSAFTLTLALKSMVPAMYFSADSDAFTQLTRSISVVSNTTLDESALMVLEDDLAPVREKLIDIPIRFNYKASPTLDDIELSMEAYEEVYGDYPGLVVVDNITNVRTEGGSGDDDPFGGLEALTDYLSTMARETEACVVGLHHVTGPYNDADKPIPLSGVKGQISRVPSMILTLFKESGDGEWNNDKLCVSTVKNRGGKADPSGHENTPLKFQGDRMQITDFLTDGLTANAEAEDY